MPYLDGGTRRDHLARLDMCVILKGQLGYKPGESPVPTVKQQVTFGFANTPCIARSRVSVMPPLLSPARLPIQVTQDLRSFWKRTYAEVTKEL